MRTLFRADVRGRRLKLCKTKPSLAVRTRARRSGERRPISCPSSQNRPELGRSRQPRIFMSVVLPEPEAPIRATISPRAMVRETPLSTGTSSSPRWYVLVMFSRQMSVRETAASSCVVRGRSLSVRSVASSGPMIVNQGGGGAGAGKLPARSRWGDSYHSRSHAGLQLGFRSTEFIPFESTSFCEKNSGC